MKVIGSRLSLVWLRVPVSMALLAASLAATALLAQEKVLRIAMTAADIPRTLGQPDQGFEGNRFTGIPMYDALTHWDLSKADAAERADPRPGHRLGGRRRRTRPSGRSSCARA